MDWILRWMARKAVKVCTERLQSIAQTACNLNAQLHASKAGGVYFTKQRMNGHAASINFYHAWRRVMDG
jgi:hypothetical protein